MLVRDNLFTIGYVVVNLVLFLVIEIIRRDVGAGNAAGLYIKGYGAMLLFNIAFLFIFRFLRPAKEKQDVCKHCNGSTTGSPATFPVCFSVILNSDNDTG